MAGLTDRWGEALARTLALNVEARGGCSRPARSAGCPPMWCYWLLDASRIMGKLNISRCMLIEALKWRENGRAWRSEAWQYLERRCAIFVYRRPAVQTTLAAGHLRTGKIASTCPAVLHGLWYLVRFRAHAVCVVPVVQCGQATTTQLRGVQYTIS